MNAGEILQRELDALAAKYHETRNKEVLDRLLDVARHLRDYYRREHQSRRSAAAPETQEAIEQLLDDLAHDYVRTLDEKTEEDILALCKRLAGGGVYVER